MVAKGGDEASLAETWLALHERFRMQFWDRPKNSASDAERRTYYTETAELAGRLLAATEALLPALHQARREGGDAKIIQRLRAAQQPALHEMLRLDETLSRHAGGAGRSYRWRRNLLRDLQTFAEQSVGMMMFDRVHRVTFQQAVDGVRELHLPGTSRRTLYGWMRNPDVARQLLGVEPRGKPSAQQPLVAGLLAMHNRPDHARGNRARGARGLSRNSPHKSGTTSTARRQRSKGRA